MIRRSEALGRARPDGETPREFGPALIEVLHSPVSDEITAAFEDSYYGSRDPGEDEVLRLRRALDGVEGDH
ncbi:MAG: DUF4129 domain-containing protein, partial [Dehalococcoidia bacterium]